MPICWLSDGKVAAFCRHVALIKLENTILLSSTLIIEHLFNSIKGCLIEFILEVASGRIKVVSQIVQLDRFVLGLLTIDLVIDGDLTKFVYVEQFSKWATQTDQDLGIDLFDV